MVVLQEVLVANGLAVLMMFFLLNCRRKNRESVHTEDRVFDCMCLANLLGALFETAAFLVDGHVFPAARQVSYLSNSLCFMGTVSIGLLWAQYVDLRIYQNHKRLVGTAKFLVAPWLVELTAIVLNLFGTGLMFSVSPDNVYQRAAGAAVGYVTLVFYFTYSVLLVVRSRRQGINLDFFPIQYFVGPCVAGVAVQFFFYGITTAWVSTALALVFVQMQTYAENLYKDELSGLFNRRYLGQLLERRGAGGGSLYGIMIDINDFKAINDRFGHGTGDHAICTMGDMLFKTIPGGGVAVRYAGDEFVVLLPGADEQQARATMDEIRAAMGALNESGAEPFRLSAAMGYARFEPDDTAETFLRRMDEWMYAKKREFHEGR